MTNINPHLTRSKTQILQRTQKTGTIHRKQPMNKNRMLNPLKALHAFKVTVTLRLSENNN